MFSGAYASNPSSPLLDLFEYGEHTLLSISFVQACAMNFVVLQKLFPSDRLWNERFDLLNLMRRRLNVSEISD